MTLPMGLLAGPARDRESRMNWPVRLLGLLVCQTIGPIGVCNLPALVFRRKQGLG